MSNIEEDDDAFLYGDDDVQATGTTESVTGETSGASDEKPGTESAENNAEEDDEDDEDDDDDDDEDSDSDIEFIIGSEETKTATATDATASATTTGTDAQTATGLVPEAIGEVTIETEKPESSVTTTEASITRVPGIEINKVGEFEGKPITSINLQDLKEKPWRQPGADVSEYFNYGFNELTWTMYCAKQDKLRANYNPQKAAMEMLPLLGMGGMAIPGMPTMPAMPTMPGFPQAPGIQLPTLPGGLPFPMMPAAPAAAQAQPQGDSGVPNGPASLENLPRVPQRSHDSRDRSDRDVERNNNNNTTFNKEDNSGSYRDRDSHREKDSRRPRYRGNRR